MVKNEEDRADENLRELVVQGLNRGVAQEHDRLVGLEERVLDRVGENRVNSLIPPLLHKLPSPRLALAGSVALLLLIGLAGGLFIGSYLEAPNTVPDKGITFMVAYPEAEKVALAGDFTNWEPRELKKRSRGLWAIQLDLQPGRYEYNFIVNEDRWVPDPRANEYVRSYNQMSSVIYVGNREGRGGSA